MKDNFYDLIKERLTHDIKATTDYIVDEFEKQKPFAQTQIPNNIVLQIYEDLGTLHQQGSPIPTNLFSKYDSNTLNRFIYDMEQLRAKRGGK